MINDTGDTEFFELVWRDDALSLLLVSTLTGARSQVIYILYGAIERDDEYADVVYDFLNELNDNKKYLLEANPLKCEFDAFHGRVVYLWLNLVRAFQNGDAEKASAALRGASHALALMSEQEARYWWTLLEDDDYTIHANLRAFCLITTGLLPEDVEWQIRLSDNEEVPRLGMGSYIRPIDAEMPVIWEGD